MSRTSIVAGVEVVEWGRPEGTPLLFMHGLGPIVSAGLALDLAGPIWAGRGFRVIAPNAPGFGNSPALDPEQYSVARIAEEIVAVVEELGLPRFAAVGFSWGGRVALRLPPGRVTALVLLDSGYRSVQEPSSYAELVGRIREEWPSWDDWDDYFEAAFVHMQDTPSARESLRAAAIERNGRVVPRIAPEIVAGAISWIDREPDAAWWERWRDVPVGQLTNTEGPFHEAALADFVAVLPDAEILHVPDAGHALLVDNPEVTIPLVAEFLARAIMRRA